MSLVYIAYVFGCVFSLQTATFGRVGTEQNYEEENLCELSQDRVIKDSHNITTTTRVSTMVSGKISLHSQLEVLGSIPD